ncbi:hypothetical protein TNIN_44591 [Trichonephila inaurata madagascariensis]|uniref:Uncharacterized protein n=1 Tax=Trichonephila inaurata madagascariensis TaxID=2747483 RepID=A0A8X6YCA2_9ARAC|nr:hypothetical protein TNIN_44591 [Trichonephila inaurata madagascariensis]
MNAWISECPKGELHSESLIDRLHQVSHPDYSMNDHKITHTSEILEQDIILIISFVLPIVEEPVTVLVIKRVFRFAYAMKRERFRIKRTDLKIYESNCTEKKIEYIFPTSWVFLVKARALRSELEIELKLYHSA